MKRNFNQYRGIVRTAGSFFISAFLTGLGGCASEGLKPVDLYPEDACALCRMMLSEPEYAAEILTGEDQALKFDDIGCMLQFQKIHPEIEAKAMFVHDYDTHRWIPYDRATVVVTSIRTPMGSGKVAFSNPERADEILRAYPATAE